MKNEPSSPFMLWFIILWVLFGIGSWIFIQTRSDAVQKRLWYRRFCISGGIIFGAFTTVVFALWGRLLFSLIVLPFLALIMWLNLRSTFFCDSCGKMTVNQFWFSSFEFCPKCGKKLTKT